MCIRDRIETSHIAIHVWDEERPALVQCDVYSCAEFSTNDVLAEFVSMEVVKLDKILINRDSENAVIDDDMKGRRGMKLI